MRPHLFIATPCYGGLVTQGYMQSVCGLMAAAPTADVDLTLALLGQDALITRCRNTLVSHFMAHPLATHILFIDADISFSPENVFRLLQGNKPVAAGIYPLKAYYWDDACHTRLEAGEVLQTAGLHYVGRLQDEPDLIRDGDLATAAFAGTGFMLITRDTITRLIAAYPETGYRSIDAYPTTGQGSPTAHALFDCMIDPDTNTYISEDFTFCKRWQQVGGRVWLDTVAPLTHSGFSDFHGVPSRRFATGRPRSHG